LLVGREAHRVLDQLAQLPFQALALIRWQPRPGLLSLPLRSGSTSYGRPTRSASPNLSSSSRGRGGGSKIEGTTPRILAENPTRTWPDQREWRVSGGLAQPKRAFCTDRTKLEGRLRIPSAILGGGGIDFEPRSLSRHREGEFRDDGRSSSTQVTPDRDGGLRELYQRAPGGRKAQAMISDKPISFRIYGPGALGA
jgi:hypothetical protein